jgi:hypothetical protein
VVESESLSLFGITPLKQDVECVLPRDRDWFAILPQLGFEAVEGEVSDHHRGSGRASLHVDRGILDFGLSRVPLEPAVDDLDVGLGRDVVSCDSNATK